MSNENTVHLTLRVSKEIKAKLYELAKQEHRSMTSQIEYMIERENKNEDQS